MGAEKCRALALPDLPDGGAAYSAGLFGAIVNQMLQLEITAVAAAINIVAQGAAAGVNGSLKCLLYCQLQTLAALFADAVGCGCRVNAGAEQGFAGVDVANANQQLAVHDDLFDRLCTLAGGLI